MRKFTSFFVICVALLSGFCGSAWGETLTVAEGTSKSNYVPITATYTDVVGTRVQTIYPASMLESLGGKEITAMSFPTEKESIDWGTPSFSVKLAEVDETAFASNAFLTPTLTEVYAGRLSIASYAMTISFSTPFIYSGEKSLLIDITVTTKSGYDFPYFLGTYASNAAYGNKTVSGSNGRVSFRPTVTFTYGEAVPVACPKPKSLAGEAESSSSATITWKKGGSETAWDLQYSSNNGVSWTTLNLTTSNVSVDGSGNCTYTLGGLSAQTTYKVQVRANCGGGDGESDYTSAVSFTTLCGAITSFPWTETFEGGTANTLLNCWDNSGSTTSTLSGSNPYYVWGVYSYGGNKMLRMNNYWVQSGTALINTPTINLPAAPKLTFKYAHNANCGTFYVKISTNNGASFSNIGSYTKGSGSDRDNPGTFTTATINLSSYAEQSVIIQFYASANYGSGAIFVDDVHIESTQDCSKPSTPVASDITGTTAHLSWTAKTGVTSYKYIYKTSSTAPTSSDWESASTTGNTYVDLSALTSGTTYYFWVMCACGTVASDACSFTPLSCPLVTGVTLSNKVYNGVRVNWTTSGATDCDVRYKAGAGAWNSAGTDISAAYKDISGLTVGTTYTFEVKPSCSADGWVAAGETYTPVCPTPGAITLSNERYNGVTVSWPAAAGVSTYNLRYRKGSDSWTTVNDIAALTYTISSGLVTNQEYTIEVQSECGGSYSSTTYTPIALDPAVVSVNSITETSAVPTWTEMTAEGAIGYKYILVDRDAVVDWSAATSVNSVTFSASLTGLTLGTDYDVYVRTIYPGPIYSDGKKRQFTTAVNKPTGLTMGELTSSSVEFSWTAGGGATQYQYLCLPSGTTPTDSHWSSSTLVSATSVTVTGLTPNTSYKFHVRAYYNGKVSAKVSSSAFTTLCGIEELNFSQNFGTTSGVKPACWTCERWMSGGTGYWYSYLVDGTNYGVQYMTKSGYPSADLQTPQIDLSDQADLTFKYSNHYSNRTVPASVIISNGVTTETVDLPTTASGELTSYAIDLSNVSGTNFTGTTVTITFRGSASASASLSYFRLDDVAITRKACTTPTANTPTVTHNSATITWTDSRAEEWSVRYRTYNAGEWTVVNSLTVKSYTMTGLSPETEYEVQVRNDCSVSSSSWTSSKRFTTTPVCPIPSGLTNSNATYNGVTVSWTAGGDETGWNIQTKPDGGSWSASAHVASATYEMSGLTTGTTYHYRVQADCGGAWVEGTYTPVCPTITDITLTNETVTGVHVNWTLSGGNVPCSVRYRSALELLIWHTAVSDTEETSCAISGLTPDITYHIQVKTACGDWISAEDYTPRILPPTPTITPYDGSVKVTWGEVLLASGYQYVIVPRGAAHNWSNPVSLASNPTEGNPLIISGLSPATEYDLYVRTAYGLIHSLEREELFATITMPPVGLTNTALTSTTASFTWNKDANSSATQFQWACKPGSTAPTAGDWSEPLGTDVRNCTVSELEDGTDYTFYVRTYYGEGVYSSPVSLAFTTECGIKQLDYIENFEDGNPRCWTTTLDEWSTLGNRWEVVDDEGHQMRFNARTNSATINYLIMPQIYLFTEAELSFLVKNVYYPVSSPEYVQGFVVVSDGVTEREFSLMNASSFTKQTIDLAEFTGKTITIKFYSTAKLTHTAFIELDDVAVKAVDTWIFTNNTGDGLWTTKGNWDKGIKEDRIPAITDDVSIRKPATVDDAHATAKSIIIDQYSGNTGKLTIKAQKGLEVAGTITRTTNGANRMTTRPEDLVLESSDAGNASLIFNNSNSDQARVGFYSKGFIDGEDVKNYQYIGVPVTEANALYNYYGSWIYSWSDKGSGYGWKKVPNGGTVYAWIGYCITQEAPTTYAIEGTLVPTTSQDITVPANENMVVGNSWMAPIDINAFEDGDFENLDGNVYFFNTGVDKTGEGGTAKTRYAGSTYVTVPIHSAPYTGDDHIASMQGFFVKNTSGSEGTLHLNYAKHVRGTTRESIIGDALHAPKRDEATEMDEPVVLKITVSGDNYDDKLVLLAREDFSNGFDNGWDGDKWDGNESAQYIYTPDSEGIENSVSAVPEFEGTIIGFRAGEDNEYTMYFEYLNSDEKLYLWDTETGDYTVIKTGYAYAFTTSDNDKHARFIITRSNGMEVATGVDNVPSDKGQGTKARKLLIEDKLYIMVDGVLFDATGKLVR